MGFNEKTCVGVLATTIIVYGWYFTDAFGRAALGQTTVAEFGPTLWVMFGAYIVLLITATVISAILSHKEGEEMGEKDERDRLIEMKAERLGSGVQSAGIFGLLVMVMFDCGAFALAHAILGVMVLNTLVTFSTRLYLYRRGA